MADPLSIASGAAGLVSLTIQATQLACKYVAEVSRAGETVLQCLQSLSLLRDVLVRFQETAADGELAAVLERKKSQLIPPDDLQKCEQSVEKVRARLTALFHDDGKIKRRHALVWPFHSAESKDLIEQLQRIRDMFAAVMTADTLDVSVRLHQVALETQTDVRGIRNEVESGRRDREAQALVDWIFPEDMDTWRLGGDRANLHNGTDSWFLDSTEFLNWIKPRTDTKKGVLWCVGAPGSGKSVLMSHAIAHIREQLLQTSNWPPTLVLSHFCDHRDSRTQSPDVIIRHLMRQAALQSDTVLASLSACADFQAARKNGRGLRLEELSRVFLDNCLLTGLRVLIVIDGLDECADDVGDVEARIQVLQLISTAAFKGARVLTASRDLADIRAELSDCCTEFKVRAPDADLRLYVTSRLHGIEKRVPQAKSLKSAIIDKVVEDADGIFLLARLMMDMVAPSSINNVRQIKKFLGEGRCDLTKMYRETLARIMSNNAASADLARKILLWLCYAQRPLHESEIQHALATELEDDDFDPDGITPGELLQGCCMGIVVCDSEGIYSLFHMTAYDFFRSSPELTSESAHMLISKTCLRYLSFSATREEGPCRDLESLEQRRKRLALLDYAAKHWADHARQVEAEILDLTVSFLTDDVLRRCLAQAFFHRKRDDAELRQMMFDSLPTGSTALEFACGRGLLLTAKRLLAEDEHLVSLALADDQGWTPLISASSYGQLDIIDLLLDTTAAVESSGKLFSDEIQEDDEGQGENNETSDEYTDDDESDGDAQEPEHAAGLEKPDEGGWTPLFWAVVKGQKAAAERLLAAGASVSIRDASGWTPIDWAAFRADRSLVTLLLEHTREQRSSNAETMYKAMEFSPIFLAAAAGDTELVETLVQYGTTAQQGGAGQAAIASYRVMSKVEHFYGSADKRQMFTSIPSVVMTKSFSIRLFESAILSDQLAIVKMLVELGSPLGAVDGEKKNRSALHIAACAGNERICEDLLSKGADASLRDNDGHTPLDLALTVAAIPCIRLLLAHRPDTASSLIEGGNAPAVFVYGLYMVLRRPYRLHKITQFRRHKQAAPKMRQETLYMLGEPGPHLQDPFQKQAEEPATNQSDAANESITQEAAIEVIRLLIGRGCDINGVEQDDSQTALHYACKLSQPKLVSFLLDHGADVNARGRYNETALYKACTADEPSSELVQILVERGADINAQSEFQRSPLLEACAKVPAEAVRLLIANGAEVNVFDNLHHHPLHMACSRSLKKPATRDGTVELIEHVLTLSDESMLHERSTHYGHGSHRSKPTILSYAIAAENWPAVEMLQARGATTVDADHISPLLWDYAADARGETFRRLREFGADPTSDVDRGPIITYCVTKYHEEKRAVSDGFEDNVAALIEAGADVNYAGQYGGKEPLRVVFEQVMDLEFAQVLTRAGALANGCVGWTESATKRYEEVATLLVPRPEAVANDPNSMMVGGVDGASSALSPSCITVHSTVNIILAPRLSSLLCINIIVDKFHIDVGGVLSLLDCLMVLKLVC